MSLASSDNGQWEDTAMMRAKLTNSYHGTETYVIVPYAYAARGQDEVWRYIDRRAHRIEATPADKARARRVWASLCGYRDCTCGVVR